MSEFRLWPESDRARVHRGQLRRIVPGEAVDGFAVDVMPVTRPVSPAAVFACSIQLDRERVLHTSNCDVRALIRWGVGGASDVVVADWADGGIITVVADEVFVKALPFAPNLDAPFDSSGFETILTAAIGLTSTGVIPPQHTSQTSVVAPGGTFSVAVPPFTRAISIMGADTVAPLSDPYPFLTLQLLRLPATVFATVPGSVINGGAAVPSSNAVTASVSVSAAAPSPLRVGFVFHLGC